MLCSYNALIEFGMLQTSGGIYYDMLPSIDNNFVDDDNFIV